MELWLDESHVDDDSVAVLAGLPRLRLLHLADTQVTGRTAEALADFPALLEVSLSDASVGREAIAALQTKRPGLAVVG